MTQKNDQGQDIVHTPLGVDDVPTSITLGAIKKILISQGLIDEDDIVSEINLKLSNTK